jgi:hypothetical protein
LLFNDFIFHRGPEVKTAHPIEWHEQCAKNQFANLLNDLHRLKMQIDLAIKSVEGFEHWARQLGPLL